VPGTDVITISDHPPGRSLAMCRGKGIRGNESNESHERLGLTRSPDSGNVLSSAEASRRL
jgi:hypothetical protein